MTVEYKGYEIVPLGTFTMYRIKTIGRGSLPKELIGHFTSILFAKEAIDTSNNMRGVKDVSAITSGKHQ